MINPETIKMVSKVTNIYVIYKESGNEHNTV